MDNWEKATQAAESVLEEALSQVSRITLWIVGATMDGRDNMSINANIIDDSGEIIKKIRYRIPEEMLDELDTAKAVMGYAVEVITNHLILTQYFDKFD